MFENALDEESLPWEEPVLDELGEFLDAEVPDIVAEPPNLEGEINTLVNDGNDAPSLNRRLQRTKIIVKTRRSWKGWIL